MSMKLRDLIRKVRQCKTASEERAVIAKESAMIRTAIREEQVHYRHRNVAKLLFMHMLGYPTHFGQLECMKLTASPHFPEKRIGYLGMLLLLSEEAEVLMLATNALKSDLTSDNKFVAGLALCAIGNLATADMARDLVPEVDKHLNSPLAYLRKKACLAMARCLLKCPDMVPDFADRVANLLKDKSHGVLVTVVQLMTQVLTIDYQNALEEGEQDPLDTECRQTFLKLVPNFVKLLRNLIASAGGAGGYPVEGGGADYDPFLQVQLLTLLRLLGTGNVQASEEMNDVLAQVATNTETAKNAGNAILYECVQTIMGVVAEDGLRILAVNILGRFLLNRDNNIRYVALNTLAKCIVDQKQQQQDSYMQGGPPGSGEANNAMSALQRHRTTVVDCLKDPDLSIRQRALELIYHLVNADNVEQLVGELLNYLVLCPRDHRSDICTRILKVVDRFPGRDPLWRVDTLITTLVIAGREATPQVQSATCVYISRADPTVHALATHKLVKAIRDDDGSQKGLFAVGIWCIGEYGDLLLKPFTYTPAGGTHISTITFLALDPMAVVNTIETVVKRRSCPDFIKERALTAYAKLSRRFQPFPESQPACDKLANLLKKEGTSHSLELQLRSCEYNALIHAAQGIKPPKSAKPVSDTTNGTANNNLEADLFGGDTANTNDENTPLSAQIITAAKEALARMPVVDARVLQKRLSEAGTDDFSQASSTASGTPAVLPKPAPAAASSAGGDLLDLFGGPPVSATPNNTIGSVSYAQASAAASSGVSGDLALLADIFASPLLAPAPTTASVVDMFAGAGAGAGGTTTTTPAAATHHFFGTAPTTTPAPSTTNLFGGGPPAPDLFGSTSAPPVASAPAVNPLDLFGAPPAAAAPVPAHNLFAASPASAPLPANINNMFGATAAAAPTPPLPTPPTTVKIPGMEISGVKVVFECSKPDTWNKQKSLLVAHFYNSTGDAVYGVNLQVAVPKHVTMEMEPASSTTLAAANATTAKPVTQKVHVTNSLLGTKTLALKLKLSFSLKGQKVEHMATCSGFPAGLY